MSTFVLVHGAWHGSWCWAEVVSHLQTAGHNAIALDLPGRAGDPTPYAQITLASYADKVRRVVELQREPVVLVGHSMGGLSIAAAAELRPDCIRTLVFVSAFLPRDGETLIELAQSEADGGLLSYVAIDEQESCVRLVPEAPLAEIFYGGVSDAAVARAKAMLVPEPLLPGTTPISLSAELYGSVPRVYVECTEDRAVPIDLQRRMHAASLCRDILRLESDHSPFLSMSAELASCLAAVS